MLGLSRFLPGLNKDGDGSLPVDELSPWECHQRHAPKHGPARFNFWSTGQQRRAQARADKAYKRKTNKRLRAQWMDNESAKASLRGQLWVVANADKVSASLYLNALDALEDRFTTVDRAREFVKNGKL